MKDHGLTEDAVLADSRNPEKLVIDATPILSALLGGKAKRLFLESTITEFAVAGTAIEEVRCTSPRCVKRSA